jgi:hypothetical protein
MIFCFLAFVSFLLLVAPFGFFLPLYTLCVASYKRRWVTGWFMGSSAVSFVGAAVYILLTVSSLRVCILADVDGRDMDIHT